MREKEEELCLIKKETDKIISLFLFFLLDKPYSICYTKIVIKGRQHKKEAIE